MSAPPHCACPLEPWRPCSRSTRSGVRRRRLVRARGRRLARRGRRLAGRARSRAHRRPASWSLRSKQRLARARAHRRASPSATILVDVAFSLDRRADCRSCWAGPCPRSRSPPSSAPARASPTRMTTLVDAVLGRPDDEAAAPRRPHPRHRPACVGQIALAGFQSLAVRRAGRGARRGPSRRHRRARPPPARSPLVAWACGRLVDRPAARRGWTRSRWPRVAQFTGLALEGAALAAALAAAGARRWRASPAADDDRVRRLGRGRLRRAQPRCHALATLATAGRADRRPRPAARRRRRAGRRGRRAARARPRAAAASRTSRRYLEAGAAITLLYLASVEVVTLAGPEHTGPDGAERALGGRRRRRARPPVG